ncbi:carbon catabolite repressor protein 4 homolog 1-like [Juglans microcarpa x Juglans regia]|uniref:poly(A)-specific ribonuclease n=2 Tax=Juglans regia TaxID=51240 RepID=A0A2I4GY99_JUGRE|nr:carbon catabolite repressor protein 4 homolog 1-like [Juglans regia]XP_018848860.1 carbon catabolite repressor protein 4 homolog 1-like [Juglans regia]XP_018848861.1 carbon catabolite repressor protein 4 homolog 1-like [Juglans regia]XP_041023675.1 carbon catabolite repressor protein 4 homolog 1-like [Juglans microcarpa x Juglans regia]XP_041023676.1 carbon catabolite repressor protein 4 homolog 1-like [Juglans microcarpa x Juglans regia]XP_041023677.1 carbon catabolite repressor protein 4 
MLSVLRVHLPSDIPIVGCELTPYVLLRRPDKTFTTDDVPDSAPLDGHFLRYKWYRIQSDRNVAICSIHPSEQATLQCLGCVKAKIPVAKSYHCSPKCFSDAWQHHRVLHDRAASAVNENGNEEEELFGRFNSSGSAASLSGSASTTSLTNGSTPLYPAAVTQRSGGETWFEVGRYKTYTPTADDIGHVLKFECVVVDAETKLPVGHVNTILTSRVIPAPSPSPRHLIPVNGADAMGHLDSDGRVSSSGTFSVLSYNILSDAYATNDVYSYCPSWALSWPYRRQNLLREIVGYRADIVCLQEVQSDHYEEFFAPELDKHGYVGLYKRKTNEVYIGNTNTIDGCATFFRRDRFLHVKKYEVEFNKAAQSWTDSQLPSAQKKTALNRLFKDNVALIVVLEAKFGNQGVDNPGKRQLLCVANTHVNVHQDLKDVKLWQVHTLLKGLEKIAASADIPMLVCGDFNSVPGSAPHSLLAMGKVDPLHPELAADPLGILRPNSKLVHQLPLVSAYSSFARMGVGLGLEQQRRRLDPTTNEPLFTNCTRDFIGTLDYIFYTADSLTVESLLELLDEEGLRKDTALPSPEWSSDHIALLAEFRCMPRARR